MVGPAAGTCTAVTDDLMGTAAKGTRALQKVAAVRTADRTEAARAGSESAAEGSAAASAANSTALAASGIHERSRLKPLVKFRRFAESEKIAGFRMGRLPVEGKDGRRGAIKRAVKLAKRFVGGDWRSLTKTVVDNLHGPQTRGPQRRMGLIVDGRHSRS